MARDKLAITFSSEMRPSELEMLGRVLTERKFLGQHLEIGTAAGGSLCKLMTWLKHRPPFVVVDPMTYFPGQRETVERNLSAHGFSPSQANLREATSWDAYQQAHAAGEKFDFVLIDGSHKYRYVLRELHWANLLNVGGLIAMHDYTPALRGVMWATDSFLRRNPNYRRAAQTDSLLILEKIGADRPPGVELPSAGWAAAIQLVLQLELSVRKRLRRCPLFRKTAAGAVEGGLTPPIEIRSLCSWILP